MHRVYKECHRYLEIRICDLLLVNYRARWGSKESSASRPGGPSGPSGPGKITESLGGVGKSGEPQVMVIFSGKNDMRTSFSWENDRKPWNEDSNDPIFRQRPARFGNFCPRIGTKWSREPLHVAVKTTMVSGRFSLKLIPWLCGHG